MSKRLWVSSALYWDGGPATTMLGGIYHSKAEAIGAMHEHLRRTAQQARDIVAFACPVGDALILEAADLIRAEREGGA